MMHDIIYVSEYHPVVAQIISLYNYQARNLLYRLDLSHFPIDTNLRFFSLSSLLFIFFSLKKMFIFLKYLI